MEAALDPPCLLSLCEDRPGGCPGLSATLQGELRLEYICLLWRQKFSGAKDSPSQLEIQIQNSLPEYSEGKGE